ncbi:MAG: hypothetical protein WCG45_00040 [bacterium]
MNKDKKIIIVLVIIIIVLVVGGIAFMAGKNSKEEEKFPVVENNVPPENQVVDNNQQKKSCLIITSPLPNTVVSFPLNIEGYINLSGAQANTCTKWGAFEGIAGSVVVKDTNGNVKSSLVNIKTVGDYYTGMDKWPVKGTIKNLTKTLSTNEIALFLTSDNASGDPAMTATKIIQPLKVTSSVSDCLPTTTPWIKVLSPNGGGMEYRSGEQMEVKWKSCNVPSSSQDIYVSLLYNGTYDNMPALVLSNTVLNDGIETFTIPVGIMGNYKVLIGNSSARVKSDLSDGLFMIEPARTPLPAL